ncbi:MAG: hypothetical protein IJF71_05010 [Clostridia bacterium]|nr:hypothetical protein [Clostridia bacterium]
MKKLLAALFAIVLCLGAVACGEPQNKPVAEKEEITLNDTEFITWYGRTDALPDGSVSFDYTASGFAVKFRGTSLSMRFTATNHSSDTACPYITVITDGEDYLQAPVYALNEQSKTVTVEVAEGEHTVRVLKRSEAAQSRVQLNGVSVDGVFLRMDERKERYIEIYGDSITCGYGNINSTETDHFSTATEDGLHTYGFMAAEALNAEASILSVSGIAVNMNVWNGAIKLPQLLDRASYYNASPMQNRRIPDVVVINGGANDNTYINQATGAEKEARKQAFIAAYAAFLTKLRAAYPGVKIICCTNMLNEGGSMEYLIGLAINAAGYDTDLVLLSLPSYIGDGVGADGHPTYVTHEKAAAVLEQKIKEEMQW